MHGDDVDFGISGNLKDLDSALNELGMLATSANDRTEYKKNGKNYLKMLTLDTRYVSNVSIGFRVRSVPPHVRYKPYKIPKERYRTRSENNDGESVVVDSTIVSGGGGAVLDDLDINFDEITKLKKTKSLENIVSECNKELVDLKMINNIGRSNEVEVVSKSIQNLRVAE